MAVVVIWLLFGLSAGWLASILGRNPSGLATYLGLGVAGALGAGFLFSLFGGLRFSGLSLLIAFAGSSVVLTLYLGIHYRRA